MTALYRRLLFADDDGRRLLGRFDLGVVFLGRRSIRRTRRADGRAPASGRRSALARDLDGIFRAP